MEVMTTEQKYVIVFKTPPGDLHPEEVALVLANAAHLAGLAEKLGIPTDQLMVTVRFANGHRANYGVRPSENIEKD